MCFFRIAMYSRKLGCIIPIYHWMLGCLSKMAEPALYFGIIGKFSSLSLSKNAFKYISYQSCFLFLHQKKIFFIILSLYLNFLVQLKCSIKKTYIILYSFSFVYRHWNVEWIFIHASLMGLNASQLSWIIHFFNKRFPYLAFKTPWKYDIVGKSVSNQFNIFCLLLLLNR